jgi:hypothetical protein
MECVTKGDVGEILKQTVREIEYIVFEVLTIHPFNMLLFTVFISPLFLACAFGSCLYSKCTSWSIEMENAS